MFFKCYIACNLLLITFSQPPSTTEDPLLCQDQKNCNDCMKVAHYCRWCQKAEFQNKRCNTLKNLEKQGCDAANILDYPTRIEITTPHIESRYFKITPGAATVYFRPYQETNFDMVVNVKEFSPVETAIVLDFSKSMKSVFDTLILKVTEIVNEGIKAGITKIGVTKFVDKASHPIINYRTFDTSKPDNPFNFGIISPLSNNAAGITAELRKQEISTNIDMKEAILDAIIQTAKCPAMSWSTDANVIRSIVAITDDLPKIQGEGRIVGVFRPHDSGCHVDSNKMDIYGMQYDYPSIGQTGHVLLESKMEIIFAVDRMVVPYYEKIVESWKGVKSKVTELDVNNLDLVNLILQSRRELNSKVEVSHSIVDDVEIVVLATCTSGEANICNDVRLNVPNTYRITVRNTELFDQEKTGTFYVSSLSTVNVIFKRINSCTCSTNTHDPTKCSNHGIFSCGGCVCDTNWGGPQCACQKSPTSEDSCKNPNTRMVCSGKGTCDECGKCSCYTAGDGLPYSGDYCECDRKNCGVYENKICGGEARGKCKCNSCECKTGFFGRACENEDCNTDENNAKCIPTGSEVKCSGVGVCQCGKCSCPLDKKGTYCELEAEKIDCSYFEGTAFCFIDAKAEEKDQCNTEKISVEQGTEVAFECVRIDPNNCKVFYNYKQLEDQTYKVTVKSQDISTECIKPVNVGLVTGLVFLGIILVGLLIIGGYFLTLYFYYRADYKKFENELSKQSAEQANPLFQKKNS